MTHSPAPRRSTQFSNRWPRSTPPLISERSPGESSRPARSSRERIDPRERLSDAMAEPRTVRVGRALSRRPGRDGGPDRAGVGRRAAVIAADSLPLTDRRLSSLVDVIRAELGCRREIEVRESGRLTTPATIGWRRPDALASGGLADLDRRGVPGGSRPRDRARAPRRFRLVGRRSIRLGPAFLSSARPLAGGPLAAAAGAGGRRGGRPRAGRTAQIRDDAGRDGVAAIGRGRGVARPRRFYRHRKHF